MAWAMCQRIIGGDGIDELVKGSLVMALYTVKEGRDDAGDLNQCRDVSVGTL